MQGKIIKKTVPNEPIVRKKNQPGSDEIIIESGEEPKNQKMIYPMINQN